MTIRHDGFYRSFPTAWEDWHAGVRMHGRNIHFWRFYPDLTFVKCARDTDCSFDFWSITNCLTDEQRSAAMFGRAPQIDDGQRLCTAGKYELTSVGVHAILVPDDISDLTLEWDLTIIGAGIEWHLQTGDVVHLVFKPFS